MTSFEDQLTLSAPSAPLHSDELDRELLLVNARAEDAATSARARPRRRLALSAFAVLGAVAAGTGAAAATGIVPWFDTAPTRGMVTTSTGMDC